MGCIRWSISASYFDKSEINVQKKLPNPNPKNYEIINYTYQGKYLIVLIQYPDCKNFEGRKILVFRNIFIEDLWKQKEGIDPHFSDNDGFHSPIARFVPTLEGWEMAIKFVKSL